jgi:hypothetical protein
MYLDGVSAEGRSGEGDIDRGAENRIVEDGGKGEQNLVMATLLLLLLE